MGRARLRTAVHVVSAATLDQLTRVFRCLLYDVIGLSCFLPVTSERERAQEIPLSAK